MREAKLITSRETIDLRSRILRPGLSVTDCHFPDDDSPSCFHLGVFDNAKLVCNGTFFQQGHEFFPNAVMPYRLRGMATDGAQQGTGLGRMLIAAGMLELEKRHCDLLWFNARVSAEIFYEKLGFKVMGDLFDIPTVGSHKIMFKTL